MKTGDVNETNNMLYLAYFCCPLWVLSIKILPLSFTTQAEHIYQGLVLSIKLAELEPIINLSQALNMQHTVVPHSASISGQKNLNAALQINLFLNAAKLYKS